MHVYIIKNTWKQNTSSFNIICIHETLIKRKFFCY